MFVILLCNPYYILMSVYPHRASLKNMPGHGGNRTYDLWNTSPMLCQLSYAVRSVRVCDISESSLVPSISMQSSNHDFYVLVKLARCGYTLRVTSQASYSPEYITPHDVHITQFYLHLTLSLKFTFCLNINFNSSFLSGEFGFHAL